VHTGVEALVGDSDRLQKVLGALDIDLDDGLDLDDGSHSIFEFDISSDENDIDME